VFLLSIESDPIASYDHAIRAMTNHEQLDDSQEWVFGLFLNQQWLRRQGEKLMAELVEIKQSLKT
jgi:hypothetical protein